MTAAQHNRGETCRRVFQQYHSPFSTVFSPMSNATRRCNTSGLYRWSNNDRRKLDPIRFSLHFAAFTASFTRIVRTVTFRLREKCIARRFRDKYILYYTAGLVSEQSNISTSTREFFPRLLYAGILTNCCEKYTLNEFAKYICFNLLPSFL